MKVYGGDANAIKLAFKKLKKPKELKIQTSQQTQTQLLDYLVLLETLQALENYKEFCYNLYLLATHTEVKDTNYVQTNPHYNEATYNRYFHTDALGSITAITDDSGKVVERRSYEAFGKIRAMDYGLTANHAIIPTNTVAESTRAFTGHEQIAEIDGLIHMNARVYDSDIGRFLSADTVVQDPHDSQAYNRYAYVRNNPLKYTDPTGNSWWTKFRDKWLKPIVSIVVAAVIAIYAPQFLGAYINSAFGVTVATGALAGAASGAIMTGTLSGTLKGAAFGAISAGVAYGIGEQFGHAGSIFGKNVKAGQAFIKATAHGLSRGVISMAQGGTFKSGFASGFSSSFFSPGTSLGGEGAGGFTLRTTIAGVVGGTASEIGGGKFANGAVSGAFVHMFNAEWRISLSTSGGVGFGGTLEKGISVAYNTNKPWYKFFSNWSIQRYSTIGYGAYADASYSGELNIGWSRGQTAEVVLGSGITGGSTVNTTVLPVNGSAGYEVFVSDSGTVNLHNISIGIDSPGGLPMESHAYRTSTTKGW